MSFTRRKEDFACENCGRQVAGTGYTNHCPNCLWSKHVDVDPGDRAESCRGMMRPVAIEGSSPEYRIVHICETCGARRMISAHQDDNIEALISIAKSGAHTDPSPVSRYDRADNGGMSNVEIRTQISSWDASVHIEEQTHAYSVTLRSFMLATAALILVTSPLYADDLVSEFPIEIIGVLSAVIFAALSSHLKKWVLMVDAALAGATAVLFQIWAIVGMQNATLIATSLRECIAIVAFITFGICVAALRTVTRGVKEQVSNASEIITFTGTNPLAEEEQILEDYRGESA